MEALRSFQLPRFNSHYFFLQYLESLDYIFLHIVPYYFLGYITLTLMLVALQLMLLSLFFITSLISLQGQQFC